MHSQSAENTMAISRQETKLVLLLSLALLSCLAEGQGEKIFDVTTLGAKPDGKTDSSKAFLDAWKGACTLNGPAKVVVPKGDFFIAEQLMFMGPCTSPTPLVFEIVGNMLASTDTSSWKDAEWITFEKVNGLHLIGGGTFNGQGEAAWGSKDCPGEAHCPARSVNFKFREVKNAELGPFTSLNPKGFHLCINTCENVKVNNVHITAPGTSPNTDGIHVSHSVNVEITNTVISTGDDCVSIIQGDTNVTVANVHCGPGHGISVGSLGKYKNEKDVHNIFVRNCTLANTDNGCRIKTWRGAPPSAATNIIFEDIIMENVKNPILIDQEYCASGPNCRGNIPSQVKIEGVTFRNIRGTSTSKQAVKMRCSPDVPCQNVEVHDIDLKFVGAPNAPAGPAVSECANIKPVVGGVLNPAVCV